MQTNVDVIAGLRAMLRDVLAASASGTAGTRLGRAHGYVDGYMRALIDLGFSTRIELLEIVANERERFSGPAVRVMTTLDGDEVAA